MDEFTVIGEITDIEPTMTTATHTKTQFVVCVDNRDNQACLELHKIYRTVPDEDAEADGDIRIVDESARPTGSDCNLQHIH